MAKFLKIQNCFSEMLEKKDSVAHLASVGLSELESISIDDGVGARGK